MLLLTFQGKDCIVYTVFLYASAVLTGWSGIFLTERGLFMDDVGRYMWSTIICILLILIAMFFSASEVAVVSLSESKLKKLSDEENRKASELYRLKEHQFNFTLWSGTSALLCMLAACCLGVYTYAPLLEDAFAGWFDGAGWAMPAGLIVMFFLVSFLVLVFGQALPKKLVSYHPEDFAFFAVTPLRALRFLFKPLTWLILKTARLIVRILGYDPNRENADITEEEIRMLVDAGNENGTIEYSEREMINNIFEFDDRTAGEVMTHRTDIAAVEKTEPLSEVLRLAIDKGFSRIPIYEDDIDNIIGVIYAKDLLSLVGKTDVSSRNLADYMRPVIFAPESTRCRMLFKRFKETKVHMSIIVDEYGGTAGIVTMEDLLESIVGNIQDEYDQETDEIERMEDGSYSLDGGMLIDKVEELFNVDLDADEDTDTIGGLVVNTLGRIPGDGEEPSVIIKNIEFTVLLVSERRIVRIKARPLPEISLTEEEDEA